MNNEVIIGVLIMKKIKLFIMLEILCIGICGCGLTNINEQNNLRNKRSIIILDDNTKFKVNIREFTL